MTGMGHKIATCNYCGTRAALVLDRARHELACSRCGAPLHDLKALPKEKAQRAQKRRRDAPKPGPAKGTTLRTDPPRKRREGLLRRLYKEIRDVVEDIID